MDLQHLLAVKLAKYIIGEHEEKAIVVTYGIEVFLNEFLKLAVALIIGVAIGKLWLVLFTAIYLLIMRRLIGGRHFKSNILCFIVSLAVLVEVPYIASITTTKNLEILYTGLVLGSIILVFQSDVIRQKKIQVLVIYLGVSIFLIIIKNYILLKIIVMLTYVVIIAVIRIPFARKNTLKCKN